MAHSLKVDLIAAVDVNYGIGKDGHLPWRLAKEYEYFIRMITKTVPGKVPAVIMGRRTWEEISPEAERFTANRIVIIVSKTLKHAPPGTHICHSYEDALNLLSISPLAERVYRIWNLGGRENYKAGMNHPSFHRLYLTRIDGQYECDTFFPSIDWASLKPAHDPDVPGGVQEDNNVRFEVNVYERIS